MFAIFAADSNVIVAQDVFMQDTTLVTCESVFYDSGGGNQMYGNNESSTLIFRSASSCILEIQFNSFDLGMGDTLFVFDACSDSATPVAVFTWQAIPSAALQSTGNCLSFYFTSDANNRGNGWQAEVFCPTTPVASIFANGPTAFCGGDSVTLIASGGISYQWNTSDSTDTITVSFPGTYTVTVTGSNGCSDTASRDVIVYPLPPVGFILDQDTFCTQDPPYFMSGGFPVGGVYSGAGVFNNVFDPAAAGQGIVTVSYTYTDTNGCSRTIPQSVTVLICQEIKPQEDKHGVVIFPNPVSDILSIDLRGSDQFDNLSVFDVNGRIIRAVSLDPALLVFQLDVHDLSTGIYLLEIKGKGFFRQMLLKR